MKSAAQAPIQDSVADGDCGCLRKNAGALNVNIDNCMQNFPVDFRKRDRAASCSSGGLAKFHHPEKDVATM